MAKSRSESILREAFCSVLLRGVEGDEAISRIRKGEENDAWPGQNALPYFLALEGRGLR